ncbi:hypothetical protein BJ741DRAFT_606445 [Chytriomyces cf. hyalinus JEL632]|nr:hypothetical protein BJ741DRAFT_606445 [Chytriomyces cf. hyalinus JEL632]
MDAELAAVILNTVECAVESVMAIGAAAAEYAEGDDSDCGSEGDGDDSSDDDGNSDDESAPASPCPQQRTLKRHRSEEIESRKKRRSEREAEEEALCAAITTIGERLSEGFSGVAASIEARNAQLVPIPSETIFAANLEKLAGSISLLASVRLKHAQTDYQRSTLV